MRANVSFNWSDNLEIIFDYFHIAIAITHINDEGLTVALPDPFDGWQPKWGT